MSNIKNLDKRRKQDEKEEKMTRNKKEKTKSANETHVSNAFNF